VTIINGLHQLELYHHGLLLEEMTAVWMDDMSNAHAAGRHPKQTLHFIGQGTEQIAPDVK
jgi:hypothetical protein